MKRYILLISMLLICTVYIFYNLSYDVDDSTKDRGDKPTSTSDIEEKEVILGGTIEEPINSVQHIADIQTDYVKYNKGLINFNELTELTKSNLEQVSDFPFNPLPNYLFNSGFSSNSVIQVYYQSNNELTKTIIYRVETDEKKNRVEIIYNDQYLKLVSINSNNPEILNGYDDNHNLVIIEVFKD